MKKFLLIFLSISFFILGYSQGNQLETVLQKGHSKYITAADFHPSGEYCVTAGYDNAIILWNVSSGKQIRMFNRHTAPVWSVVFSPDGSKILSTSADATTKLYEVSSGKLLHSWNSPKDDIRQAYFSSNGKLVMLINNRDLNFVYDVETGEAVGEYNKNYSAGYQRYVIDPTGTKILSTSTYKGAEVLSLKTGDTLLNIPFDKTFGMEFSPDGSKIVLSSAKLFAKIFDATTGKEIADLTDPDSEERCDGCNTKFAWSNSSKFVVTMSNKTDAILWDATTGKKLKSLCDIRERPTVMKFTPDDSHLMLMLNGSFYAYDLKSGKQTMELKGEQFDYFDFNYSPDGSYVLLPGQDNTTEMWNIKSGKKEFSFSGFLNKKRDDGLDYSYSHWTDVHILKYVTNRRNFALSPDNKFVVIGSIDTTALMINLQTGKVVKEFVGHSQVVIAMAFSPDGKTLATAGGDRKILLWDVASGRLKKKLSAHRNLIFDVAFNSDGTQLISASWDGTMGLFDLKTYKYILKETGDSPYKVGFSPNDLYIVAGNVSNSLEFIESDALESFRNLVGNTSIVGDYAFSPNAEEIVTACWDGKVKVWNVLTGMQTFKMADHSGAVYTVSWDPSNKYIASAGADNSIRLWDCTTKKLVKVLSGHTDAVTKVVFSSDGKQLISMSIEGQLKVWDLNTFMESYARIQISRDQWLATTPKGHFDGTSKALNMVNYVSGMDVIPVGSLFDKYFSPGLIKRINDGEKFNETGQNINKLIGDSPLIAFQFGESSKRGGVIEMDSVYKWKKSVLPLGIRINSQNQELEEIRVYNNGKLIIAESLEEKLVFRGGEGDVRTYEIPLSDGDNHITGLVINKDRTESAPTQVLVAYDGEAAQTDLYILSIGINEYKNPKYNLDYAVNDAKSFTKALVTGGGNLFNQTFEYAITNENATKEEILNTLTIIKDKIGPEDVFVFYYAGHGVMSMEKDPSTGDFYIVTHDVLNLYGDAALLKEKAISAKELMYYSMEVAAEKQLFVLDACHSGGALDAFATRGDGREKALAQLARSTGTFFLTASQDAQYANEVGDLKHGLFTFALLEIIEGKVKDNGDNKLTINEVKSYVEDRVPELSEQYRGSAQYPTSYSFGQDFPLVILK